MALFFLLSHQRSGSHFLKYVLDCHNNYLADSKIKGVRYLALPEVLTPGMAESFPPWRDWLFEPFLNDKLPADPLAWGSHAGIAKALNLFLDRLEGLAAGQVALVDIKLNQLHLGEGWYHEVNACPRLLREIARRGKILLLRRRNLVRAIVSGIQATETGIWHVSDPASKRSPQTRIKLDPSELIELVAQLELGLVAVDAWLQTKSSRVLKIDYENLFDQQTHACNAVTFDRIAKFMGLKVGLPWQTTLQKIGLRPLSEVVLNFKSLKAKLASTKYAEMLDAA